LLDLRLQGVKVEEATSWLEKISGKIEVEQLYPSWLIFADGFRFSAFLSDGAADNEFFGGAGWAGAGVALLPFIVLAVKLTSPGPVLLPAEAGRAGEATRSFTATNFAPCGRMRRPIRERPGPPMMIPASPRFGKFLRTSRLDEIPQLWCVLKGDMHFVGPRPERPEFVEWLSKEIRYLRCAPHGAAGHYRVGAGAVQVRKYAGRRARKAAIRSVLYQERFPGPGFLDHVFQTIKIVLLGRGAQ
jgi:lipopolysaccharide/colanic/teichoic acid biosynthesis glycosyltransferase